MSRTERGGAPAWVLREVDAAARDGILALREQVFSIEDPEKRDPVFWTWEFLDSPDGEARLFVAQDGDRIVGHYAIIPQAFSFAGEPVRGSIVVDVMTHPDYRFQGMFKKIGRYALGEAADTIGFATGYPIRKEVMPGHLSIGWRDHLKIPVLDRPLRWRARARRFRLPLGGVLDSVVRTCRSLTGLTRVRLAAGESIHELGDADLAEMESVSELAHAGFVHRERTATYFRWRYLASPVWKYSLLGLRRNGRLQAFVVLRRARLLDTDSLAVVDMACRPGEDAALSMLVRHAVREGSDQGLAVAGAMVTRGTPAYAALRRAGFYPGPHRFTLILYALDPALRARVNAPDNRWFLMWGDTDDV